MADETQTPLPVRDFVGKFFVLGLFQLAGYAPTGRLKGKEPPEIEGWVEGKIVNRVLLKTLGGKRTVRPIFEPKGAIWDATRFRGCLDEEFKFSEYLCSIVAMQGPQKVLGDFTEDPEDDSSANSESGLDDKRSLTRRRIRRASSGAASKPWSAEELANVLRVVLMPGTISDYLGMGKFNDTNKAVLLGGKTNEGDPQGGSETQAGPRRINSIKSMREFYSMFIGSVLTRGDETKVSLERTVLGYESAIGKKGDEVPDRIEAPRDQYRVTLVAPKRLLRVARIFGFGCDLPEDTELGWYGDQIKQSSQLRFEAWKAFAGEQIDEGNSDGKPMKYYGESLADFTRKYAALIQSAIEAQE